MVEQKPPPVGAGGARVETQSLIREPEFSAGRPLEQLHAVPADHLAAALAYAAHGWRVLPVHGIVDGHCTCGRPHEEKGHKAGKHPTIRQWQIEATTDAERIRRFWQAHPHFNIGIATGAGSDFFVFDIDPDKGGDDSLAELCLVNGALPLTLTAVTGSGGRHFLFQHLPGLGNRTAFAPGIDIRGEGGQVVAAPSLHISGRRYSWVDERVPIAAAPDWLVTMLVAQHSGTRPTARPASEWARVIDNLRQGCRNDNVARLAGYLMALSTPGGTPVDSYVVEKIVVAINAQYGSPPLPSEEVRIILHSVARKDAARRRARR